MNFLIHYLTAKSPMNAVMMPVGAGCFRLYDFQVEPVSFGSPDVQP
jgi:hypothetical protein